MLEKTGGQGGGALAMPVDAGPMRSGGIMRIFSNEPAPGLEAQGFQNAKKFKNKPGAGRRHL